MVPIAKPNEQTFDAERTWRMLTGLFDFGDRLDFVFLEVTSDDVLQTWRRALRGYCGDRWREPRPGQPMLTWLEDERVRGIEVEQKLGPGRPREVYLATIPQDADERFVFARINENRDNLVRALNGVLCLCGSGDFVRRLAYAAPSIWAMRTRSFDLAGPPPAWVPMPPAETGGLESMVAKSVSRTFDFDVFISAGARDEEQASDLVRRLAGEGLSAVVGTDKQGHDALERARVVVVLLSPEYAYSAAWESLESSRLARKDPEALQRRLVPILLGDAVIPGMLRDMTPLDFRTAESRARDYSRLIQSLRGEREISAGPGLAPVTPVLSPDDAWLDRIPFDFSHPNARALRNTLVDVYFEPERIKRLLPMAGLQLTRINFSQPTSHLWNDVLSQASASGRLRRLLDLVLSDERVAGVHDVIRQLMGQPRSTPSAR